MTVKITKGPTLYDPELVAELEEHGVALIDYCDHDWSDAEKYLASRLKRMDRFEMSIETARHHVKRLAERAEVK